MKNLAAFLLILAFFAVWAGIQFLVRVLIEERSSWSMIIQMNIVTGGSFLVGLLIAFLIATKTFLRDHRQRTPLRRFAYVAAVPTLGVFAVSLIFPIGFVGMMLGLIFAEFMFLIVAVVGIGVGLWFHHLSISLFAPGRC